MNADSRNRPTRKPLRRRWRRLRYEIDVILAHDRVEVHDPCPDVDIEDASRPLALDPPSIVEDLERDGAILGEFVEIRREGWEHLGLMDEGTWWQAEATLLHVVHDTTHHFLGVREGLARIGAAIPTAEAGVESVNIASGGVPKLTVNSISVRRGGVEGDRQADSKYHGRPFQAVCLWSTEAIAELANQGHAIAAGTVGENVTLSGVDRPRLRPGTRVLVGTALLELSYPATPCQKQGRWFQDGDIARLAHAKHPECARWYAWIRQPGQIRPVDPAVISPA